MNHTTMNHATPAVAIDDLHVGFRRHFFSPYREVLRGVSLSVRQGEIFGFLGPNGAGKTTTIKALLGLLKSGRGAVSLFGQPVSRASVKRRLGFMPERAYYPEHLSGDELLMHHAMLAGHGVREARRRTAEVSAQVGIASRSHTRIGTYSKGMLQRLGLAQAMIGEPDLVILDEPLSGLDPLGRKDVREILVRLREAGRTVFFSTHILPDVEMVCDEVAILVDGQVRKVGPLETLLRGMQARVEIMADRVSLDVLYAAQQVSPEVTSHAEGYVFVAKDDEESGRLIDALRQGGANIRSVQTQHGRLEDVFVKALEEQP